MKLYLFAFLLFFSINLFAQTGQTFDINRSTIFFNEDGKQLSFEDFSYITSNFKNTILPKFDSNGSLEYVVLKYPYEANSFIGKVGLPNNSFDSSSVSAKYSNNFSTNSINSDSYRNVKDLEGWNAPHFSVLDKNNYLLDTEKEIGTVIVLKFWFSKCIPCLEEIPNLNKLAQKYQNQNVSFYAPSVEKKSTTERFLISTNFEYTTIYEAQKLAALYKTPGYPTHVVIGKDGKVRKVVVGERTNIYKILDQEIERALLVRNDDLDVVELDENENFILNDFTQIYNDKGELISKEEYIYLLNTGRYKIFKKLKKNGNTNLLITQKN